MSSELQYESSTTVSDLIRRKQLSSAELTGAALERIAQLDGQYHSYATVLPGRALR
jgi:amidase